MFIVHLTYLSSSVCRKYLKNLVYLTLLSCCFLLFSYYSWPLVQETGKGGGGITGHFFASNDWYNMKKGKKKASKPCDEWDARKKKNEANGWMKSRFLCKYVREEEVSSNNSQQENAKTKEYPKLSQFLPFFFVFFLCKETKWGGGLPQALTRTTGVVVVVIYLFCLNLPSTHWRGNKAIEQKQITA